MINGYSPITPASRQNPYQGYNPGQQRDRDDDRRVRGPNRMAPLPYRQPMAPYYPPQYRYPTPGYPSYYPQQPGVAAQVWHGFTERLAEVGQIVLHPFNAYARRMPFDAYMPRTTAQNVGRWLVNGGILAGVAALGFGLLGGGLPSLGLGASVGMG